MFKKNNAKHDKYSKMYFKYYNDTCARIKLLEERIIKLEQKVAKLEKDAPVYG